MQMTVKDTFSPRMKKGDVVTVDALAIRHDCTSGLMVRVVGVWKKPRWFDFGWFIGSATSYDTLPKGSVTK